MKLIGISGKCQSGKDTIFDMFEKEFDSFPEMGTGVYQICFADSLRTIVWELYCDKKAVRSSSDLMKQEIKTMKAPCGKTHREILQIVGTDYMRNIDPDCWIRSYVYELEDYYEGMDDKDIIVITTDVRFPNELKCIQDQGGKVIRLTRNPLDLQHESEMALDYAELVTIDSVHYGYGDDHPMSVKFDEFIDNVEMNIEEQYAAFKTILRNWEYI